MQGTWEMPSNYILMTNVLMTPARREAVNVEFAKALPGVKILTWGGQDVCDFLDNLPNVRLAFPHLLGIRDVNALLLNVLNKSTLERTKVQLRKAVDLARVFAPTRAHDRAVAILQKHRFVVLTGPPEMGKTTIGLMVCLALADDDWQVYDCVAPKDVLNSYDADTRQVFFVDDAFGSTEYRPDKARPWGDQLESILLLMDDSHWLIWTSRPAPLNAALASINLQGRAERFPSPGEVRVNANELTLYEKAAILYRHCKSAGLTDAAKKIVKSNLSGLITHDHFTPERIRRFVEHALPEIVAKSENPTAAFLLARQLIKKELDQPTDRMRKSFDNLKLEEKMFLIAMLDEDSGTATRTAVHKAFEKHLGNHSGASPDEIADILAEHFIRPLGDENGS